MASSSDNFNLVLPARGEFTDNWHTPVNQNFIVLDREVGNLQGEVEDARGSSSTLADRLDESLNADGSAKPTPETLKARSSQVYGRDDGSVDYDLDQRILQNDLETFVGRQGELKLRDMLARMGNDWVHNSVVSAPNNYLSFTGADVKVDGSTTNVFANINGYLSRVRKNIVTASTGAAGERWFSLNLNKDGVVVLDSTLPSVTTGTVLQEPATTGPLIKFKDAGRNFASEDVKPGDYLIISTPGSNEGTYVVAETFNENPSIGTDEILIQGNFQAITANLAYTIVDPFAATLVVEDVDPGPFFQEVADKIYVGQGTWDGATFVDFTQYRQKARFTEWQAISLTSGNFEAVFNHRLGVVPTKFEVYASQSNDFSSPIVPLGISSGPSGLERSVVAEISRTQIRVKNPINGLFYKDYDGVTLTSGFLYIKAER